MNLSRRAFTKLAVAVLTLPAMLRAGVALAIRRPYRNLNWNTDWRFKLGDVQGEGNGHPARAGFDDSRWERVNLPHWGHLEPCDVSRHYQGFCWYRKRVIADAGMRGCKVWFACEGAMQVADVWVNGTHRLRHAGGYLPFSVDLSDALQTDGSAQIAIRLDNRDNPDIPPARPLAKLDFCYFSGMYRDVALQVRDALHITDPIRSDTAAGGGVFVRWTKVSREQAEMCLSTEVRNEGDASAEFRVLATLHDEAGRAARVLSDTRRCATVQSATVQQHIRLPSPALWSPETPHLYTLTVRLMRGEQMMDEWCGRMGVRWLETDPKRGFFLNGTHRVSYGTNRHQAYPYAGNAISDNAQYRDARKLKDVGFDLIRLAHYPQAPAFLDACDELGMMVIECTPGWQFFQDSDVFKSAVIRNQRELIRRDRNHACAVLWETTLNETYGHDAFFRTLAEVAHEEYPGSQMPTCGDAEGHDNDVIRYEVPYSGWDDATHTRPSRAHGAMSLHREYGDNQFGMYSRYSRGDGKYLMLVQCWNYQTALNQQLGLPYTWGQCAWEAVDNNRGGDPKMSSCGMLDPFRLPKFLYYFFQSQRNPREHGTHYDSGPMVFIANYWTAKSWRKVAVFSNADEVVLLLNGREIRRQKPDSGPDVPFGDDTGFDQTYWMHEAGMPKDKRVRDVNLSIYGGGNCRALRHPPFTFDDVDFEPGELKAVAYLDGQPVAETVRRTPGPAVAVQLNVDLSGRDFTASGSDLVFVHAAIVDAAGTTVPDATHSVHFDVDGPAQLIGDNPRAAEAGIASILLRSTTRPGEVRLRASVTGLRKAAMSLASK